MKYVAILFGGRITSFEKCFENFKKNILDSLSNYEIHSFLSHNSNNTLKHLDTFINDYNVKLHENCKIDLDEFRKTVQLHRVYWSNYETIYLHFHKYRAFSLMENYSKSNNIKYDIVIFLRADQLFETPLPILTITDNTIYIPMDNDHCGLNDQFAIGNFQSMKFYCNLFNEIQNIFNHTKIGYHTETYVLLYLKNMNIVRFHLQSTLHPDRRNI